MNGFMFSLMGVALIILSFNLDTWGELIVFLRVLGGILIIMHFLYVLAWLPSFGGDLE